MKQIKKIAITNEKGGVGKTMTAVNLSACLAQRGYRVLLIDADPQGYATLNYDVAVSPSLLEVLRGQVACTKAVQTTRFGVDVLPSDRTLSVIEEDLIRQKMNGAPYLNTLEKALEDLPDYDFVIIDCPPQGGRLMDIVHYYADAIIMPMFAEDYGIHALTLKAEAIADIRRTINPNLKILGGLITINTNTTPVFRKSNNLYGYNFARKAHSDHLILAEGYMDVIALQTAGFAGAVASLGTSLTEEQAKLIGRSCKELTICYDSDSAGIRATQRAIQVLRSACPELRVSVASLGEGKDPDEFIKMHPKDGAERLAEAFKAAISDTEYRLQMCKNGLDMNVNKDRLTYAVEAVRVLATVENPVEQDLFAAQIAAEVGVGRESILAQVQAAAADPANKTVPEEIKDEEIFEPEEEPTQRYHAFIRPVSDAESEVVAFADVIINEDYRINGVRLVLDEHNRFSVLMPAYLAKDRREWVPYVELKPEIEREMTAFLARNFDFNSEVEVIGGGTAIDVGETKLTLRKAANRNTVKAYAELQNDVFALKYGKIMEGKRGYFYSPPSMGTYTDQNGNKQYQYAYGFASAPERTRISGEIKKQYELMCRKNKQVYETKIK